MEEKTLLLSNAGTSVGWISFLVALFLPKKNILCVNSFKSTRRFLDLCSENDDSFKKRKYHDECSTRGWNGLVIVDESYWVNTAAIIIKIAAAVVVVAMTFVVVVVADDDLVQISIDTLVLC
jgi:hypothetical protein